MKKQFPFYKLNISNFLLKLKTWVTLAQNFYCDFISAKICGQTPNVANSIVQLLSNPYPEYKNSFGTFLNYVCKPGYLMIDGKNLKTCDENGLWSGRDLVCKSNRSFFVVVFFFTIRYLWACSRCFVFWKSFSFHIKNS